MVGNYDVQSAVSPLMVRCSCPVMW